jgi:hypothetical protein
MLAEMALLRRLRVARLRWRRESPRIFGGPLLPENLSVSVCEGILLAAGVQSTRQSLVRLEGRGLITSTRTDERSITGPDDPDSYSLFTGMTIAAGFDRLLLEDPMLVAAYRKVTQAIDKVIRVDGKALLPESARQDWLSESRGLGGFPPTA